MNITDTHKTIAALAGTAALAVGAVNYFVPRSEAAEQAKATKQEVQKSVSELRAELLLLRVKQLAAKESITADEKLEMELNLAQVKAIQADAVASKAAK